MSYYTDIKNRNLIGLVQRLLKAGVLSRRDCDGKFVSSVKAQWDTPWVHVKQSYKSNCYLWKDIIFHHIVSINLPKEKWFVPIGCMDCFKVVIRPQTLKQLFALEALERRLNHPSKAGIEIRPQVFGHYGGYFYNRGLQEGLECYKKVRKAVNEDPDLGPDVSVILKRACTEMEAGCGPSDKWEVTEDQLRLEMLIKDHFAIDSTLISQSEDAIEHVKQTWIDFAWDRGDPTVYEYLDGEPLHPPYVTYHHLIDEKPEKEIEKGGE